jgi:hypothetical protein
MSNDWHRPPLLTLERQLPLAAVSQTFLRVALPLRLPILYRCRYTVKDITGKGHDLRAAETPKWEVVQWLSICGNGEPQQGRDPLFLGVLVLDLVRVLDLDLVLVLVRVLSQVLALGHQAVLLRRSSSSCWNAFVVARAGVEGVQGKRRGAERGRAASLKA